jgi:hypothetical protein
MKMSINQKHGINPKHITYIDSMHRLGRTGMVGAILILLGIPTILGIYFDAMPNIGQIIQSALPLIVIFLPSNFFEVISYTPILGSSIYLTLITGEVINLKLPVVNHVMKVMNIEPGTEDADIIASIAVGVASFLTLLVVTTGVILVIPLQSVLTLPAVNIAASNVLPSLFGALLVNFLGNAIGGGISARGRLKGAILPIILIALIKFFDPQISHFFQLDKLLNQEGHGVIMTVFQGFVIIAMLPITYFGTKLLYKKGQIQVYLPENESRD